MPRIIGYHRPSTIEEALAELAAPGARKVVLAGGTSLNAGLDREPIEVIDLQALGIDAITIDAGRMTVGAMVTLQDLADHPETPAVIADLARREAPSTLRAAATIGGLVATADPESELLAGLLVHETTVRIADGTDHILPAVLAAGPDGVITAVEFDLGGTATVARTARTPGDRAIVAAVARNGMVALTGVAATPVLVDDVADLDPPADFRGSGEYRRHLAAVLVARVRA